MPTPDRFTTANSLVMLVDHQTGTLGWVKSLPQATVVTACRVLARMAVAYDMPLVLTTTMEQVVGETIPDIATLAPMRSPNAMRAAANSIAGMMRSCVMASPHSVARRS